MNATLASPVRFRSRYLGYVARDKKFTNGVLETDDAGFVRATESDPNCGEGKDYWREDARVARAAAELPPDTGAEPRSDEPGDAGGSGANGPDPKADAKAGGKGKGKGKK